MANIEVKYVPIRPIRSEGMSLRDTWDKTGQFCYHLEDQPEERDCIPVSQLGEVKLRTHGEWSTESRDRTFIERLSAEETDLAARFNQLIVRYMATERDNRFAIQIFYVNKGLDNVGLAPIGQTIYALGTLHGGTGREIDPQIHSMCYSGLLDTEFATLQALLKLTQLNESPSKNSIRAQMVNDSLPLLKIGAAIVRIYALNFRHLGAVEAER